MEDFKVIKVKPKPEPDVRPDVILDPEDRHTEGVDSPKVEAPGSPEDAPPALQEPFEATDAKGEKA
jgi:hypothetical protein